MAYPIIWDADTKAGTQATDSTSWTLTYPTNIASGDLLLAFVATNSAGISATFPANWNRLFNDNGSSGSLNFGMKECLGSETGTFAVTFGAVRQGAWRIFRITNWFGGSLLAHDASWDTVDSDSLSSSSYANLGSAFPNPPNCDPANWAIEDTLWLVVCGVDASPTIDLYPYPDRNTADSPGTVGAALGSCTTVSAVSSLDPDVFTISPSEGFVAATVAVRPAPDTPSTNAIFNLGA